MYIHKFIGKLPGPKKGFVWQGHRYTGLYSPLSEKLDENDSPIQGQRPVNKVDEISLHMIFAIMITLMKRKGEMM